jgi:hypothetical protein
LFKELAIFVFKKIYLCMMHCTLIKKIGIKSESSGGFFLETISCAKEEERTASADCKLVGFKHKIFEWRHRIVK